MDQVSQAISALRVGRGTVRRFKQSGPWGLNYSGLTGSGFHVILHGTGWLLSADASPVPLKQGDVVLVTSGADHGLSHHPRPLRGLLPVKLGTADPISGTADFEFLCGAYRLQHTNVHPYLAALPDLIVVSPAARPVVDLLDEHESSPIPSTDTARYALLDLMLVGALSQWLTSVDRPPTPDPAITAILRTIDDSPHSRWSVQDLSRAAGMSRATFTRRFTSAVGRTPQDYLLAHRLDLAARLLRETDDPLASIARRTGYATQFSLAAAFRREYGTPPGHFRRSHLAQTRDDGVG
ncbi:AraC family transcriptional regulator [Actinoplanes couchii]|uniref:AraC family transcriptional regulator n=1 Tax=Actinoplanes couchii TaxID=403638 RepID=A0ABQ3X6T2_9ACTN|nr:AraC family transcriptional regulator [Actinoplanes couchii]MDR6322003.1 AraC-like DNA-binding protein [Actinoplanes couchii]GID54167.1 AraC family transcriptional regulator [Actinoplanes couchii]